MWRDDLADLAHCPNVSIKLGGLGMIICGAQHHLRETPPSSSELAEAWRPYVETCIELLSTRRCMFESNFPVDKAMSSYHVLWNAYKRIVAGASESEKSDLFYDTAARVYAWLASCPRRVVKPHAKATGNIGLPDVRYSFG